ncbi:hypothetical protein JHK85_043273 [Glycine max]|nr:hypothetical protein JHK85_043273 [Glycine max]
MLQGKKAGSISSGLKLTVPAASDRDSFTKFRSEPESGTFKAGDLLVNNEGVRIVSENEVEAPPPIRPQDNQLSLADIDTIKVIGKGNGGVVQLVQHKWTNQFFALKEIQMPIEEPIRRQIAQELKINQSAQCPYVVVCYNSFYHNGVISIILEYMDGGSLEDLLSKVKTIPESYLSAICKQPERIIGNQHGYNYKSDIWSLGLILLKCATGQFPYTPPDREGWENIFQLIEVIVEKPSPSAPSDDFSPEFCSFISAW